MALTKKDKDRALKTVRRNEHLEVSPHIRDRPHKNKKKYDRSDRRKNKEIDPGSEDLG